MGHLSYAKNVPVIFGVLGQTSEQRGWSRCLGKEELHIKKLLLLAKPSLNT